MLNPQSPIPLYHQLAEIFTDRIRTGIYQPKDLIPSETSIADTFGVGRPTVRQAMDILVRKGLIERKRGSGTYVKDPDAQVDIFSLAGTSQAFLTRGIQTRVEILTPVCLKTVSDEENNPFYNQEAYYFSRLTRVEEEPVLLETFYLHPQLFKGIETMDLENRSLSSLVSDQFYLSPVKGHQTFKLSFLDKERSAFLNLTPNDPILEVRRKLDFPGNSQAIFSRMLCRTDRFSFSQTIQMEG